MKELLFFILVVFLFTSIGCNKTIPLVLEREDYLGDELRIDGYYFQNFIMGNGMPAKKIYFLYRNGVILYGTVLTEDPNDDLLGRYKNGKYHDDAYDDITAWGVFRVDGEKFEFERWYPSSGGPAPTSIKSGKILNDTTFHITEQYNLKKGKKQDVYEIDNLYHFQQFSQKPDSTNNFIE